MFLSCDWGTSSFRIRLVSTATLDVVAEEISDAGVATVFKQWQQKQEEDRLSFYLAFLHQQIATLEQKLKRSLQNIPLIISGMASSTIGMTEIAYKQAPFQVNGSDLEVKKLKASSFFPREVYIISGVKTDTDVMRGEETQLVGCLSENESETNEEIVVLPGTHSKHVLVKGKEAVSFQTFMTGEFFDLLSQKSILSRSVEQGGDFQQEQNRQSFEMGLMEIAQSGLLQAAFRVRTNQLFGKLSKEQNYYYLSGMLIGAEISELLEKNVPITVVSNQQLIDLYREAFRVLMPSKAIRTMNETKATIRGQFEIYSRSKEKE